MKSATEIFELAKRDTEVHDKLERILWLNFKNIIHLFKTGQIDKEKAALLKQRAVKEFEEEVITYETKKLLYQAHFENIKKTELLRAKLRKDMTLENALELIEVYSGERWRSSLQKHS